MFSWFRKTSIIEIPERKTVSVRMEAVGGQGANSAGKILAEAAVLGEGFSGNHFSSFGSEKRGSPVKSYLKFSTEKVKIRSATHIANPDVLIVFHENLIKTHHEVLEGATENTYVLINSEKSVSDLFFPKAFKAKAIVTLPASQISLKNKSGLNAAMLGAAAHLLPELKKQNIEKYLQKFFSHLPDQVQKNNFKSFQEAAQLMQVFSFDESKSILEKEKSLLPEMGWANSPLGGVILNPGNSVIKDHSVSRKGVAPQLDKELCFNCGFCDMVCPDFCFVWAKEVDENGNTKPVLKGIDYQYCKGCQKCVTVCPVEALKPVQEEKLSEENKSIKLFPDLKNIKGVSEVDNTAWVHYVEHLSETEKMRTVQTELLDINSYLRPNFTKDELNQLLTEDMQKKLLEQKK